MSKVLQITFNNKRIKVDIFWNILKYIYISSVICINVLSSSTNKLSIFTNISVPFMGKVSIGYLPRGKVIG